MKSKFIILNFPIEPINDRYSIQWNDWFAQSFKRNHFQWCTFLGDTGKKYEANPEEFLNPGLTFDWKFKQLRDACHYLDCITPQIKNEKIVGFFQDFWFPGIEALKYIAEMKGIDFRMVGFAHAGSYLSNDMLGIKGFHSWARGSEQTWFRLCDAVCVGSNYHRDRILASLGQRDTDADKMYVTGYPIEVPIRELIDSVEKENIVVWPHRIAEDKHPEIFEMLAHEGFPDDWRFIRSKDVCETKNEYHNLLAKCKICVSTATMETFGISMIEAACLGCDCIVPNSLCYPEFFSDDDMYSSYKELVELVRRSMENWSLPEACYQEVLRDDAFQLSHIHSQIEITNSICDIIKEVANG